MELLFNAAIGIILCGFLYFSTTITDMTVEADLFGSGGFPMLFSVIGLLLLLLSTWQTIQTQNAEKGKPVKYSDEEAVLNAVGGKKTVFVILVMALYIFLLTTIGFPTLTFLFLCACVSAIGYRDMKWTLLFACLFTALLIIVFGRIFFIALPRGIGIFKEISYFLY